MIREVIVEGENVTDEFRSADLSKRNRLLGALVGATLLNVTGLVSLLLFVRASLTDMTRS